MWLPRSRWDQAIGSARRVYACVAHSVEARPPSSDSITRTTSSRAVSPSFPASSIGTAWARRPQPRRIPTQASAFAIACERHCRFCLQGQPKFRGGAQRVADSAARAPSMSARRGYPVVGSSAALPLVVLVAARVGGQGNVGRRGWQPASWGICSDSKPPGDVVSRCRVRGDRRQVRRTSCCIAVAAVSSSRRHRRREPFPDAMA